MIGTAYIGAALNMGKTEFKGLCPEVIEDFGPDILLYRIVLTAWRQVLADAQVQAADSPQIPHDLRDFFSLLSHTQHDAGFGAYFRGKFNAAPQYVKRTMIIST
jgi:hypothetical protein